MVAAPLPYRPETREDLRTYIETYIKLHGNESDLNHIDLSGIDSLDHIFENLPFDGNISKWDVSHITSFVRCFYRSLFTGVPHNISSWKISPNANVRQFALNGSLNCDISTWNLSKYMYDQMGWLSHLNPSLVLIPCYYQDPDDIWFELKHQMSNASLWPHVHLVHWQLMAMYFACPPEFRPDYCHTHPLWSEDMTLHVKNWMPLLSNTPIQDCGRLLQSTWGNTIVPDEKNHSLIIDPM